MANGSRPQIDVQLPVWEVVGELVGRLDRQRGLADATHPVDRADHHRSVQPGSRRVRIARTADRQQAKQRRQLAAPTGEVRRRARQLPRDRQAASPRCPYHRPGLSFAQLGEALYSRDLFPQRKCRRGGLHTQLLGQH
jgi:hypothetical protein